MKNPLLIYLLPALLLSATAIAQTNTSTLYSQFDNSIGKRNLGLNNGTIHLNTLKSADKSHRYFKADAYSTGSVVYDGQTYSDVALKYDLYKNVLIAKVDGKNNHTGINLISQKVGAFAFYGKNFINIDALRSSISGVPQSVTGFYEQERIGKITLYAQYRKEGIEVLLNEGVHYRFADRQDFALVFNGQWRPISSQSDVIAIFPSAEANIRLFYNNNGPSEKNDPKTFYTNLLRQIDSSLP